MACNLYKIPSELTPVTIIYTDCDGVDQPVSIPAMVRDYYFCSTNLISVPEGTIEIGICNCSCQSINVSRIGLDITYVDCNDNIISESIPPSTENPLYVFCTKYIISNSSPNPVNPVSDKDCLSGTCNSDTSCYTFTPTGDGTGNIKYYDVNGDLINTDVSYPINFCARGIFSSSNGVLVNNNTPCTSNYDCNDCGCYTFILPPEATITYINCNGEQISSSPRGEPLNVCSNGTYTVPLGTDVTYNGPCVDGVCVENCFCFTINPNGIDGTLSYMGCDNNNSQIGIVASKGIVKVCGQYIIEQDLSWDITQGNLCLDAQYCVGDCECYVFTSIRDGEFVEYIDCNNVILTGYTSGGTIDYSAKLKICSKSILNVGIVTEYNLGSCVDSICNTSLCDCYTVAAGNLGGLVYLDCNDTIINYPDVVSRSPISFCAQTILSNPTDPIVEVSKGLPCIDGECPATPITGDCTCYYVIDTLNGENVDVTIIDCNDVSTILSLNIGESFCAKSYISASIEGTLIGRSDGLCVGGESLPVDPLDPVPLNLVDPLDPVPEDPVDPVDPVDQLNCPQNVNCYNIDAGEGLIVQTYYISTEGVLKLLLERGPVNICAKAILTVYDSTGNPTGFEVGTVTNTGDCVLVDGGYNCPAPCYCFYATNGTYVTYIDCNYQYVTSPLTLRFNKICAQSIVDSDTTFYNSGLFCQNNKCPNYLCNCYTITNLSESDPIIGFTYLSCDFTMSETYDIPVGESLTVCALNIPNIPTSIYSVTYNGRCYNGICLTGITEIMIYELITNSGPCPDICNGTIELGGPAGTSEINIFTGYPISD